MPAQTMPIASLEVARARTDAGSDIELEGPELVGKAAVDALGMPTEAQVGKAKGVNVAASLTPGAEVVEVVENGAATSHEPPAQSMALVPFQKARGKAKAHGAIASLKQKYLQGMEDKSPEECRAALAERVQALKAKVKEACAAEEARVAVIDEARAAYHEVGFRVEEAIKNEVEAARMYRAVGEQRKEASKAIEEKRSLLLEAQTKVAMLEVLKMNQETVRHLKEQREAAVAAMQEAKRSLVEMKQTEKKAFEEATRQALAPFEAAAKGGGRGQGRGRGHKRALGEAGAEAPVAPTEEAQTAAKSPTEAASADGAAADADAPTAASAEAAAAGEEEQGEADVAMEM